MKNIFLLVLIGMLFGMTNEIVAQKEANIWYFGENAGLDFNSGAPVVLTDGLLNTIEGCATISDESGNLMFYTDGKTIWDQSHTIMSNGTGLLGDISSTQSAIIVPKPGVPNIYYVFTVGTSSFVGLHYSEVDMSLNGGMGAVTTNKNILLVTNTSEKLTAVVHDNKQDVWVIVKGYGNAFHSFLVSNSGINMTAVSSNVGYHIITSGAIGYLKASHDGQKLAVCHRNENIELLNFDNATGQVSYQLTINAKNLPNSLGPYGIEFSPNNQMLYYTEQSSYDGAIYQVNLLAGSNADIVNSVFRVDSSDLLYYGMQLATDGKIYLSVFYEDSLTVINAPNLLGNACDLAPNSLSLNGQEGTLGLPNFIQSYFNEGFSAQYFCWGAATSFHYLSTNVDSVVWNFDDPISGIANSSNQYSPQHVFSNSGAFDVRLIAYQNGMIDTIIRTITILPPMNLDLGADTVLCDTASLLLTGSSVAAHYLWQDGSTDTTFLVDQTGLYAVTATLGDCVYSDSIRVQLVTCYSDSFSVANFCLGNLTQFYYNSSTTDSVLWNFGDVDSWAANVNREYNPQHVFSNAGTFTVTLKAYRDGIATVTTKNIVIEPMFEVDLGQDTILCDGLDLLLTTPVVDANYLWQNGSTDGTFLVNQTGNYTVVATNSNYTCPNTDSIYIEFVNCMGCNIEIPDIFTPNDDGYNDVFNFLSKGNCLMKNYQLAIYNRWGEEIFRTDDVDNGWDGRNRGVPQPQDVYLYRINYELLDGTETQYNFRGQVTLLK